MRSKSQHRDHLHSFWVIIACCPSVCLKRTCFFTTSNLQHIHTHVYMYACTQGDIDSLDWSLSSPEGMLMSTCTHGRTLFWGPPPGLKREANVGVLADAHWVTWTARVGWHVQGLASLGQSAADLASVDKCRGTRKRVAAALLRSGQLVLAPWPCPDILTGIEKRFPANPSSTMPSRAFAVHSREPSMVRFSCDDEYVVTAGGSDLSIMVWKHIPQPSPSDPLVNAVISRVSPHMTHEVHAHAQEHDHDDDKPADAVEEKKKKDKHEPDPAEEEEQLRYIVDQRQRYIMSKARMLQGPRNWRNVSQKITPALLQRPDHVLALEAAYGCRMHDSAANCHFVRASFGDGSAGMHVCVCACVRVCVCVCATSHCAC
jgi:hypothetical protein